MKSAKMWEINPGVSQTHRGWWVFEVKREFAAGWTGQLFVFRGQKSCRIRSASQKRLVAADPRDHFQSHSRFYIYELDISLVTYTSKIPTDYHLPVSSIYIESGDIETYSPSTVHPSVVGDTTPTALHFISFGFGRIVEKNIADRDIPDRRTDANGAKSFCPIQPPASPKLVYGLRLSRFLHAAKRDWRQTTQYVVLTS